MENITPFEQLARGRRSVRRFTPDALDADTVVSLVRPALLAPTSKGRRAYELVLVDRPGLLQALSEVKPAGGTFLRHAALGIVVCGRMDVSDVWVEDASVVATTLLYSAESLGLGACWVQLRERATAAGEDAATCVRQLLGLPAGVEPLAVIGVGHKAAVPPARPDDLPWEKVHTNGWADEASADSDEATCG